MKAVFSVLLALIFVFSCCATVFANPSTADESATVDEVFQEHPMKKFTWVYILIEVLAVVAVVVIAFKVMNRIK